MKKNESGTLIIEEALSIHRELGPGLLESLYEVLLADAVIQRGLKGERQISTLTRCLKTGLHE